MEVLICAVILYLIGCVLKKIKYIKDNLIPVILAVLGCLGFLVYTLIIGEFNIDYIINSGIAAAAASVYIHQTSKQLIEMLPLDEKTKDILEEIVDEYLGDDKKDE